MTTLANAFCPSCNYALDGLPPAGTCPECGEAYSAATVLHDPLPTAFSLCLRFLWPVAVLLLFLAFTALPDAAGAMVCISVVMLPIIMVNAAIQIGYLKERYVRPLGVGRSQREQLRPLGPVIWVLMFVTLLGPPLVFGGCVVVVLWQLSHFPH